MDDGAVEFAAEWLDKAQSDHRAVAVLLAAEPPLTDVAVFHCQQAVEKVLKAFLTYHACTFEKTHDLRRLCTLCQDVDGSFRHVVEPADRLSVAAVAFRYPGPILPTVRKAEESLRLMNELCEFVLDRLPESLQQAYGFGKSDDEGKLAP